MNLEESNEFIKEQEVKRKKKNIVLALIIICLIFVILMVLMILILKVKEEKIEKLFLNDKKVKLSNTLFITQDDIDYVSIKEMANLAGYKYVQGEYEKYTKDDNSCYLQNGYEVVSIKAESNIIKKYLQNENSELEENENSNDITNTGLDFKVLSENDTMELFELENNVININENLYLPLENAEKIFNIAYSVKENAKYIYDLNYLYKKAVNKITDLKQKGKDIASINIYYENIVALCDNMVVVNDTNGNCGVISLNDYSYILESIYTDIKYVQNTNNFFVYTKYKNKTTVGLLNKEGKKIIKPTEYNSLTVFDEINKLYLAQTDDGFGILSEKGEVIPCAYDEIGLIDFEKFDLQETETPNLLEGRYIIVKEEEKYGIYDIRKSFEDGENKILPSKYDGFGCLVNTNDKKEGLESVFLIPEEQGVNGIVIKQNDYYGIFDLDRADIVIPCSVSKIYSKIENGETNYYLEGSDFLYNVKEYFEAVSIEE